jgi:hypothetical protein
MIPRFSSVIFVSILLIASGLNAQTGKIAGSWHSPGENDSLVTQLLEINSKYDDFSPIYLNGTLYFSSNRKNVNTDEADLKYNQNVYSSIAEDNDWNKSVKHYFFNNDDYTALAGYSFDGPRIFLYKTFGNGDLYYCDLNKKGKWKTPKRFKSPVNSQFTEQSIAWTDELIVISSNRGDNETFDLYWGYTASDPKKIELKPLKIANSSLDELDVSFSSDGKTLFFSSNGQGGEGGFDIFKTVFDGKGNWSKPDNLGSGINTPDDERWFMSCDSAYFMSTGRADGKGGLDIYRGHIIPRMEKVKPDTVIAEIPTDTIDQIEIINNFLDSSKFEVYYAYVQVGAFYFIKSVEEFKSKFGLFAATDIFVEKVKTERGILHKYILNTEYKTLKEAAVRQKEALAMQRQNNLINTNKLKEDAFIAVYNQQKERILIYFDVDKNEYKILIGDKYVFF